MIDMTSTIAPKSDQLNADDLIGRSRTILITEVLLSAAPEQPVAIHFGGDGGKPWMPGKSMRRVLVQVWGPDGHGYIGRRLTLFRDEKVQFGGLAVGGIRISHMSHIDQPVTMALTATKASRKPFTVKPLVETAPVAPPAEPAEPAASVQGLPILDATMTLRRVSPGVWLARIGQVLARLEDPPAVRAYQAAMSRHIGTIHETEPTMAEDADRMIALRLAELAPPEPEPEADPADGGEAAEDGWPGPKVEA